MKYEFYVTLVRLYQETDYICLHTRAEAVKRGWIDENGNRIWCVPSDEETSPTFVWGFNTLDEAVEFYDVLLHNEIGNAVEEV